MPDGWKARESPSVGRAATARASTTGKPVASATPRAVGSCYRATAQSGKCALGPEGSGKGSMSKLLTRVLGAPRRRSAAALLVLLGLAAALLPSAAAEAALGQGNAVTCPNAGTLLPQKLRSGGGTAAGQQPDL